MVKLAFHHSEQFLDGQTNNNSLLRLPGYNTDNSKKIHKTAFGVTEPNLKVILCKVFLKLSRDVVLISLSVNLLFHTSLRLLKK